MAVTGIMLVVSNFVFVSMLPTWHGISERTTLRTRWARLLDQELHDIEASSDLAAIFEFAAGVLCWRRSNGSRSGKGSS